MVFMVVFGALESGCFVMLIWLDSFFFEWVG